jgi:hypothetical protein
MRHLPVFSGILATIVLSVACSTPGSRDREALLSSTPAVSLDCVTESFPESIPSANSLVDSASLVNAIGALARADSAARGHVLLTLAFDTAGLNARREVIEHSIGPLLADSIQSLVFASRREVDRLERDWGTRFRIDIGETVEITVGRREYCPPAPMDRTLEEAMAGFNPAGVRYRDGRRERVLQVRTYIDAGGFVTDARVERGALSGSSLERELAQYLRQFRFRPATIDGIPVASSVQIPIAVPA